VPAGGQDRRCALFEAELDSVPLYLIEHDLLFGREHVYGPPGEGYADNARRFALLSREYMILSLRLGYHFTTFESMCTDEPSKNYIRMQFKGGGASSDRRIRRIGLVMDLLSRMGFEHASRGDFLDSSLSYADEVAIAEKLRLLGRLTMLTKQLDMALANDKVTQWYAGDFARKLGLESRSEDP
jgi:pyruvate,water dikinase